MNEPWATLAIAWFAITNAWTLFLFAYDKWQAGRAGPRVSESALCWFSALGGWPAGFLGLVFFRHKSAKASFQLKFAAAFFLWAALAAGALKLLGKF